MDLLISIFFAFILYMVFIFPVVAFCMSAVRKVMDD